MNCAKLILKEVKYGIEFLGAYIKPFRTYIANQTLHRMTLNIEKINTKIQFISSLISRLGILKKYSTYNIRYKMIMNL